MIDKDRIRDTIVFALLTAAENDDYTRRELGEIHLIKYLYLADLAHARWNHGQSFTGTDWIFYKFGPWSQMLHAAILACLTEVGAELHTFSSRFGEEDCKRWHIPHDADELGQLRARLPLEVKQSLSAAIQKYANDTASLLDAVYASEPMLRAAPGERLELLGVDKPQPEPAQEAFIPFMERLSSSQRKRFKEEKRALSSRMAERLARQSTPAKSDVPRDEDYAAILQWLDNIAGPNMPRDVEVTFSDSVWKSSARSGQGA